MTATLTFAHKAFEYQLARAAQAQKRDLEAWLGAIALELFGEVTNRTPVAAPETWKVPRKHTGGTARRGWRLEKTGPLSWRMYSEVPYIRRLEYGWSKQAPTGMLRRTLFEGAQALRLKWRSGR